MTHFKPCSFGAPESLSPPWCNSCIMQQLQLLQHRLLNRRIEHLNSLFASYRQTSSCDPFAILLRSFCDPFAILLRSTPGFNESWLIKLKFELNQHTNRPSLLPPVTGTAFGGTIRLPLVWQTERDRPSHRCVERRNSTANGQFKRLKPLIGELVTLDHLEHEIG